MSKISRKPDMPEILLEWPIFKDKELKEFLKLLNLSEIDKDVENYIEKKSNVNGLGSLFSGLLSNKNAIIRKNGIIQNYANSLYETQYNKLKKHSLFKHLIGYDQVQKLLEFSVKKSEYTDRDKIQIILVLTQILCTYKESYSDLFTKQEEIQLKDLKAKIKSFAGELSRLEKSTEDFTLSRVIKHSLKGLNFINEHQEIKKPRAGDTYIERAVLERLILILYLQKIEPSPKLIRYILDLLEMHDFGNNDKGLRVLISNSKERVEEQFDTYQRWLGTIR